MSSSNNNKAGALTTEAFIEHKVDIFERRFGGFIATKSKREKQDNDNDWLRKALQEAIAHGVAAEREAITTLLNYKKLPPQPDAWGSDIPKWEMFNDALEEIRQIITNRTHTD